VSSLGAWQRAFLDAVLAEGDVAPWLGVYRRSVHANLCAALAATYPVIERLVGEAFFQEAARRYALAEPSASGDLHSYGRRFAQFLEGYPFARDLPFLPDVARLEWAVAESFHAPEGAGFDFHALASVREADRAHLRLKLHPAVRLLQSAHPVAAIWEANQAERDGTPARLAGAERVLVHRDGFVVRVGSLSALEWRFLESAAAGRSLGELAADPAIGAALADQLRQWTASGVVDGFSPAAPTRP
jgi:hypothetical protein